MLKTDLSKRVYGLDILRAYAILSVLYVHTYEYLPNKIQEIIFLFVFDGVAIFFVLSGFLIGRILIKSFDNRKITMKRIFIFWTNRWMRTLPPYYFMLILLFAISYTFDLSLKPDFLGIKKQIYYFFFLQNLCWAHFGFFRESWSLCIEEWFYLLTPIIIILINKIFRLSSKNSFLTTLLFVLIIVPIFRYYMYISFGVDYLISSAFTQQVLPMIDRILYGVMAAYAYFYFSTYWTKYKVYFFFLGVLIIGLTTSFNSWAIENMNSHKFYFVLYPSFFSAGIALLLPVFSAIKKGAGVIYKMTTYVSLISYSLYLTHYTLVKYCIVENLEYLKDHSSIKFLLIWVLSFVFSTLMYYYLEKPFIDLRVKLKIKD